MPLNAFKGKTRNFLLLNVIEYTLKKKRVF